MVVLRCFGWIVRIGAQNPFVWLSLVCTALAWPLLQAFLGLGVTTSTMAPESALWQLGLLAVLIGACSSMYLFCKQAWWLDRSQPLERMAFEVCGAFAMCFVFLAATWFAAILLTPGNPWPRAFAWGALASLHAGLLVSLICAIWRSPIPAVRIGLFLALAWLIPGLSPEGGWIAAKLRHTCEIGRYFAFLSSTEPPRNSGLSFVLPIIGLACLRSALVLGQYPSPCATPSSETSTPT